MSAAPSMAFEKARYLFRQAANCLFEMSTENALRLLPPHLQPVEIRHGRSILSVTCFSFSGGDAGAYEEVVLSVLVAPRIDAASAYPNAAMYPLIVAYSTEEGRRQGIDRWHLPYFDRDIVGRFEERDGRLIVRMASADGAPILEMETSASAFAPQELLFQSFMTDPEGSYWSEVTMESPLYSKHEEGTGAIAFFPHPVTSCLSLDEVEEIPFREQWMKNGTQTFHSLEAL